MDGLCKNCSANISGTYCQNCGEKVVAPEDFYISRYISSFVSGLTNVDTKFYRTLGAFVKRPGQLSRDYFAGLRKPYLSPIQTFLIVTVVFFVFAPDFDIFYIPAKWFFAGLTADSPYLANHLAMEKMTALDLSRAELALKYDVTVRNHSKAFLFLGIPFLALGSYLSRPKTVPQIGKHLIFATHNLSFFTLWFFILLFIAFKVPQDLTPDWFMRILSFGGCYVYFALANRRTWNDSWPRAWFAGFLQMSALFVFIYVYRSGISFATLQGL